MRKDLGEFNTLYKDLRKYPDRFYTYYRMSTEQFDTILAQIQHLIYKPNSKWWRSISPEGKLAICIRYEILYLTCFKFHTAITKITKYQTKRLLYT